MITLGEEVVVMDIYTSGPLSPGGIPIQHNSRKSPAHPCRGKVLKVGRKRIHVETIGAPWQLLAYVPDTHGRFAVPIEDAKRLYRLGLENHPAYRTQAFIDQCVEGL